jgi:hypothetical protein
MARGFESKDVEFQQQEFARSQPSGRSLTVADREAQARHRTIALALSHARAELVAATNPFHRQMLQQKIDALQAQLSASILQ